MADLAETLLKRPLYVYDLPKDILSTLQYKTESTAHTTINEEPKEKPAEPITTQEDGKPAKTASCSLCGLSFATVQEQRQHVRSDLHGYNLKQKMRGLKPVEEVEFEKLVGDLDESISGSDTSESDSESEDESKGGGTMLSALLKKQAKMVDEEDDGFSLKKRKRGAGKAPLLWFNTPMLPSNTSLGVYQAILSKAEQDDEEHAVDIIRRKQLALHTPPPRSLDEGGVPLPRPDTTPHIFMCMIGGGHFAAMIVSLTPKMSKKQGFDERQATVKAHKTFHRYTTRRKQGGSQSSNDNAKGNAHSAGSSIRRYNEVALTTEIRELLREWKDMIDSSELIFIRASGTANRRTLFGPYEEQVLTRDDSRNRSFPFSTRRATQAELLRCFIELTRVKVSQVDEAALAAERARLEAEADAQAAGKQKANQAKPSAPVKDPEEETAILHTSQMESLIRRSKAPALLSYLASNSLSPNFVLHPSNSQAHHHAPTPLHLASSINSPALVLALLTKGGSDPTNVSPEGKTPFEIAGDRATRDAFRLARSELGEAKWDWDGGAKVPEPLTKGEVDQRNERERKEEEEKETARRSADLERIREEERRKETERKKGVEDKREKKMGKGKTVGVNAKREMTAEERRAEEAKGMTPEMRMRLERERRARAAEERMRKLAAGAP